ncbi:hypothetical protein PG994_014475 [Apiospora phragmitis]|uniref:Tat pathway signal sequence n=1 Tax=Apiospora phragmitis TaxID=2905665 RepID=A0ABR1T4E5_9PEZI
MSPRAVEKHQYRPVGLEDGSDDEETAASLVPLESRWRRRFCFLLLSSLTVLTTLTMGFAYHVSTWECPPLKPGVIEPYTPAPVLYVNKWLKGDPDTPKFMGKPRPEMDQAWNDLLSATAIRLSSEELLLANNATSVEHKDGGFVGGLGISHLLHCVVCYRSWTTDSHALHAPGVLYYYNDGFESWDDLFMHADHCLESLRQAILCQADVSVVTLEWTPHSRFKPSVRVPQPNACVDWDALHGWMSGRAASLEDVVGPPAGMFEDATD